MTTAKTTAPKAAKAPKPPATSKATATAADKSAAAAPKTGAQVAREAAATSAKGLHTLHMTRPFTLNRDDGTTREFAAGMNRDVTADDKDHWFVKLHTEGDAKSGVADVRPAANPNGPLAEAAKAPAHDPQLESETVALDAGKGEGGHGPDDSDYSDDDRAADEARAEAGDADAKGRLEAYEAAKGGTTE